LKRDALAEYEGDFILSLERKNILKIASVYTGTVLGAGFASGKELVSFFVSFGLPGFFGMIISGMFFSLIGFGVLKIVFENKITDYHEFSVLIFGNKFGCVSEWLVCAFLLVLFSAMIAAGGEMSRSVFKIDGLNGEVVLSCLCFFTFLFELDGFVDINTLLAPILVIGGIAIGLYIFFDTSEIFFEDFSQNIFSGFKQGSFSPSTNFVTSALIYVSYNIITAVTVLVSLSKLILSKKTAKYGGIFGGVCVFLLGVSMSLPLFANYNEIYSAQMPVLSIVLNYKALKYIYVVILLSAIFTTALANGFSLIQNFEKNVGNKLFVKIFLSVWGILMAQVGFSNFIDKIYPFFGAIGLIETFFIIKTAFFSKNRKNAIDV